ncbi:MAG: M15 family metallopeptidase [Pseudomonadota bacterium]
MADDPAPQDIAPARARRALLIGLAFVVPCAVIALSLFFIVKAGAPTAAVPSASAGPTFPEPAAVDGATPSMDGGMPDSDAPSLSKGEPAAALNGGDGVDEDGASEEPTVPAKPAPPKHFATVQLAAAGSCSTETVDGLSRQIIEQARCIKPNDFVALPKRPNLVLSGHIYPYLEVAARDHLLKALSAHAADTMTVNSALRTVAQQYLVWHWAASKICGVQLATPPGDSNHEIGSALDIAEAAKWRPALEAQEFKWLGKSDRVHFDYKGADAGPAHTATDVLAFQKLWNRNHADDPIPETGKYSPVTELRLKKSPASGFPLGASCKGVTAKH